MAVDYRKVPTRIIIDGNRTEGEKYYGLARKMLHELERNMQFQKLKQLSSFWKDKNATIECWHGFGLSQIRITVSRSVSASGRGRRQECLCGCHVSAGYVTYLGTLSCMEHVTNLQLTYNVTVCQRRAQYILLTECQPMDFTSYEDGDKVYILWVPDAPMTYAASTAGGCTMTAATWARILPFERLGGKFREKA